VGRGEGELEETFPRSVGYDKTESSHSFEAGKRGDRDIFPYDIIGGLSGKKGRKEKIDLKEEVRIREWGGRVKRPEGLTK